MQCNAMQYHAMQIYFYLNLKFITETATWNVPPRMRCILDVLSGHVV